MSLKFQNRPILALVLIANVAVWYVLLSTGQADLGVASQMAKDWQMVLPAGLAVIAAGILCEQFDDVTKARLVFWRWHNPLPGSQAFTKYGPKDSRVDMAHVARVAGALPTNPEDQNRVWYRLYKTVRDLPAVASVHREYLLLRDFSCISVLLFLALPAFGWWWGMPIRLVAFHALGLVVEYLLVRRAACRAGRRLVVNVLSAIG